MGRGGQDFLTTNQGHSSSPDSVPLPTPPLLFFSRGTSHQPDVLCSSQGLLGAVSQSSLDMLCTRRQVFLLVLSTLSSQHLEQSLTAVGTQYMLSRCVTVSKNGCHPSVPEAKQLNLLLTSGRTALLSRQGLAEQSKLSDFV